VPKREEESDVDSAVRGLEPIDPAYSIVNAR
jgi:hypothetical protein